MKLHKYKDYNEYVDSQVSANKRKLNLVWVHDHTIEKLSEMLPANNIICHGTRNGEEQRLFKKYYPKAYVIGTEISDTANQFADTVQHDFHEAKKEWLKKFDIVYSNSWDHSYDPDKSLTAWKNQLSDEGHLCIEYITLTAKASDPLEVSPQEILELFEKHNLELINTFDTTGGITDTPCTLYITKRKKL